MSDADVQNTGAEMLIVEHIEPDSLAEQAGLQPGDDLLTYAGCPLQFPAMLQALEENTFGVESVMLRVERGRESLEFIVTPGKLGIETRPALSSALLPDYAAARVAFLAGQYPEAAQRWTDLADRTATVETTAWLLGQAGAAWEKVADWEQAIRTYASVWERQRGD